MSPPPGAGPYTLRSCCRSSSECPRLRRFAVQSLPGDSQRGSLMPMQTEPIVGKRVKFPPGRVEIRLKPEQRSAYRRLYAAYRTILDGLPVLRERDFDGRAVSVTQGQLEALNQAFSKMAAEGPATGNSVFGAQEAQKTRLFKRLQYLS